MRLKDNTINPQGITTELLLGLIIAKEEYEKIGVDFVLTSLVDGTHSVTSLHYSGNAADLRIWNVDNPEALASEIRKKLNHHYDVIVEKTHIHLEYQPRQA